MGAGGCGWVRWGVGDTGGYKNKASGDKNGHAAPDSGSMAGEISPNIMFCDIKQKVVCMGADGYKWVHMGGAWCRDTDRTKNNRKRYLIGRKGHVLQG